MMNHLREEIKKVDKLKFVTDILLNAALVFIVYTVVTSFFGPSPAPESENTGAVFAQRMLEQSPSDISSPLYVRTDKMDVVVDRATGAIAQVTLRDQGFQVVPFSAENKMMLNAGFSDENLVYKSAKKSYEMGEADTLEVSLSAQSKGVSYTKTLSFVKGSYEIDVQNTATNQSGEDVKVTPNFSISVDKNTDAESGPVALKSYSLQEGGATTGMPMARLYEGFSSSGARKNYQRLPIAKIEASKPSTIKDGWLAYQSGYFVAALVMPEGISTKVGQSYQQTVDKDSIQQRAITAARSNAKVLQPGQSYSDHTKLYTGPSDPSVLAQISPGLKLVVDYGFFWLIASLLHKAMVFFHQLGLSWGWSLIAVTVILRLALYKQATDQVKHTKAMNNAKPDLDAIEKKYQNQSRFDQKRSEEVLAVYKKHRINPATSCIMPLLNLPIYMATYSMVLASYEFKSQGLLWISDLSIADPYYIMPVLAGLGLFLQGRSMAPDDPTMRLVMRSMPVVFLFVMLNAPACVALYVSLQMWIQVIISKMIRT